MIYYSSPQTYTAATPPSVGNGVAFSLKKSPRFNFLIADKYNQDVTSKDGYSNQNDLSYSVDVFYGNSTTAAPSGIDFESGIKDPNYLFSYEKNSNAFAGNPQRRYTLVFKLRETSPSTVSSGQYFVNHNEAQLSGVSGVIDGTPITEELRYRTGSIDINVVMTGQSYYNVSQFEIYTGSASSFNVVTGTGVGGNLMKRIPIFSQSQNYTLTIREGEQPADGRYYFYKILPYDDFGSGVLYSSPSSGLMYSIRTAAFSVENITGKNIILINEGAYAATTYHSGQITGTGYNLLDTVLNISGNIVAEGWYNASASGDFTQAQTYPFKTIKYLAQVTDGVGNVSSREILITDNTTGPTGSLDYSEYAVSDSSRSAQFLVSGVNYVSGTGIVCLLGKVGNPNGNYKLLRTII
jgi:hypothetical protein